MIRKTITTLLLCCILCTTNKAQSINYLIEKEIPYRATTGDAYTDSMCVLDIYFPENKENFSTLIWYHGGGLTGGQRELPSLLMEQGVAIVSVEYRLSPHVSVSQCIDDAAAAAAWVVKNIEQYGGDNKRIFVSGHSAGGFLTTMIGMDKRWMAKYELDADTSFAALIPYSGQVITHFTNRKEKGMKELQPLIDEMAPLYHVRPDCPPLLIITGDRELELLGRYEENAYFWRMLKLSGHPNVFLHEIGGCDHGQMVAPAHHIAIQYIHKWEKEK